MSDKEKIEKLLRHLKMNAKDFAASIGLKNPNRIYHVLNDRNGLSRELARVISEKYPQIDYDWLRSGEGEMLHTGAGEPGGVYAVNGKAPPDPPPQPPPVDNMSRALNIIESQQESIRQLTEAALVQARTLQDMIQRNEGGSQNTVSGKAG